MLQSRRQFDNWQQAKSKDGVLATKAVEANSKVTKPVS